MSKPFKTPAQDLLDTGQIDPGPEPERYYDWMLWKLRQNPQWKKAMQGTEKNKSYIYESPDNGKTIYRREFGKARKDKAPFIQYGKDEHEVFISEEALNKINKPSVAVDMVNHPPHYNKGIETSEYINSWNMSYSQGNVVKYVTRYDLKHEDLRKQREDLAKAKWYLNDLIVQLEKKIDARDS